VSATSCGSPETDPTFYYTVMMIRLLLLEHVEGPAPERPPRTQEEKDRAIRNLIGLPLKNRREGRVVRTESRTPGDWTGQPSPVGGLMRLAVENHRAFCTNFLAACLPLPNNKRRRAQGRPLSQTGADARGVPDIPDHVMEAVSAIEKTAAAMDSRKSPLTRTT
jgi:hypothetical protein